MKESISVTTLFQIVILFVLLFTAIMCLTINNSNAFGVKDELVNMIELADGHFLNEDDGTLSQEMLDAINNASYRTTGDCNSGNDVGYVGYDRSGYEVGPDERASICIKTVNVTDEQNKYFKEVFHEHPEKVKEESNLKGKYYQIKVFYQLDLPVVNQVYNLSSKGETRIIYEK